MDKYNFLCFEQDRHNIRDSFIKLNRMGYEELSKMNYKPPIEVLVEQFHTNLEKSVMNAVHTHHINIDKAELIKALQYDRDQYIKGFEDGCKDRVDKIVEQVRAATINEFADRVKKYYSNLLGYSSTMLIGYYVDQIAKEMLGGDGNASDPSKVDQDGK